jgi:hypothetical protein
MGSGNVCGPFRRLIFLMCMPASSVQKASPRPQLTGKNLPHMERVAGGFFENAPKGIRDLQPLRSKPACCPHAIPVSRIETLITRYCPLVSTIAINCLLQACLFELQQHLGFRIYSNMHAPLHRLWTLGQVASNFQSFCNHSIASRTWTG